MKLNETQEKKLDPNQISISRFNNEAEKWDNYGRNKNIDIISWESYKRREIVKKFLISNFKNKPLKILEIGCGAGNNLKEIVDQDTKWTGKGTDIAPNMIKFCREKYEKEGIISFEELNIDKECLEEKFDVIILLGVVGYLISNKKSFENISKMLKNKGCLIFTCGSKYSMLRYLRNFVLAVFKIGFMRGLLNLFRKYILRSNIKSKSYAGKNFFQAYSLNQIKKDLPKELEISKIHNICFSSGILGSLSVRASRLLESIFPNYNFLNLALTKLVIAKKK